MSDDTPQPPEPVDERRSLDAGPRPRGLLGLLVWPLQALLQAGLRLAFGLVEGLIRGLIPGANAERDRPGQGHEE